MSLSVILDVAIGLSVVYLAVSLFVTIINEYLAQLLKLRSKQLALDLEKLISDREVASKLKSSPALAPFFERGGHCPSYVDPNVLARQLVGGLGVVKDGVATVQSVAAAIDKINDPALKAQLQALVHAGKDTVEAFVQRVSGWVDSSLTMMGEVYKKKLAMFSLLVGLTIAVALNVDTVRIVVHLYQDRDARTALADFGADFAGKVSAETLSTCSTLTPEQLAANARCTEVRTLVEGVRLRNETLGDLPLGWPLKKCPVSGLEGATIALGWLLTALATSLGAPFWFDLLSRLVNVRHGMRRPAVSTPEGGKA